MSNNNNHPLGEAPWFHVILSTGFGVGFTPIAPGTAAAFVALVLWWIGYCYLPAHILFWTTLLMIIVTTVVGCAADCVVRMAVWLFDNASSIHP